MDEDKLMRRRMCRMQLIALGMPAAAVVYACVALLIVANQWGGFGKAGRNPWLSWVSVGFLALQIVVVNVFPAKGTGSALQKVAEGVWEPPRSRTVRRKNFTTDSERLLEISQIDVLAYLAPLEGAAFLGCIAYLIDANSIALLVTGTAIVLMLIRFPSNWRVCDWLERQTEKLAELRQGKEFLKQQDL
jgi:hypothetical protein